MSSLDPHKEFAAALPRINPKQSKSQTVVCYLAAALFMLIWVAAKLYSWSIELSDACIWAMAAVLVVFPQIGGILWNGKVLTILKENPELVKKLEAAIKVSEKK